MSLLERVFASAGAEVVIPTLEITCPVWETGVCLCNGYEDHTCVTEDGRTLTFLAAGIEIALPKRDTSGAQVLSFAIDNVTGEAQRLVDQALDAGERIQIVFRHYLSTDKSTPAEPPLRLIARGGAMEGSALKVEAAFFDLINTAWPRRRYTLDFAPGLKYL
jgi:hypothetical protein